MTVLLTRDPSLVTVRDAVALDFRLFTRADLTPWPYGDRIDFAVQAGIYDRHGRLVESSLRRGGVRGDRVPDIAPQVAPAFETPPPRIRGRSLFIGHFMNHYGHFITETLSRLWPLQSGEVFDNLVAYPFAFGRGAVRMARVHRYLLRECGVRHNDITILNRTTLFDELVVPEQLWKPNVSVNARLKPLYDRIASRHEPADGVGKVFLSRGDSVRQRVADRTLDEAHFASEGYRVIYPEDLVIGDQLRIYAAATHIAGFSGSALHNVLFAPRCEQLIELSDRRTLDKPLRAQVLANLLAGVPLERRPTLSPD